MQRSPLYYLPRDKQEAIARAMVLAQFLPKVEAVPLRLRLTGHGGRAALVGRLTVLAREAAAHRNPAHEDDPVGYERAVVALATKTLAGEA